jgi:hypothetical protein
MNDIYAKMRKPMKTFWEMDTAERRAIWSTNKTYHFLTPKQCLARIWAECDEDEILMRIKYADEIEAVSSYLFIDSRQANVVTHTAQQILMDMLNKTENHVIDVSHSQE